MLIAARCYRATVRKAEQDHASQISLLGRRREPCKHPYACHPVVLGISKLIISYVSFLAYMANLPTVVRLVRNHSLLGRNRNSRQIAHPGGGLFWRACSNLLLCPVTSPLRRCLRDIFVQMKFTANSKLSEINFFCVKYWSATP